MSQIKNPNAHILLKYSECMILISLISMVARNAKLNPKRTNIAVPNLL